MSAQQFRVFCPPILEVPLTARRVLVASPQNTLITAARHGDRGALDALLEAMWPDAYRVAYGVVQDGPLAEDAAQEACATVFNAICSFTGH